MSYLQNNANRRRMDSYQISIPNLNGPSPSALRVIGATKLTYDSRDRLGSVASNDKGTPPNPGGVKVNNSPVTAGETQGSFFAKEFQTANTATPFIIPLTLEEPPSPVETLGEIYVPKNEVVLLTKTATSPTTAAGTILGAPTTVCNEWPQPPKQSRPTPPPAQRHPSPP